MRHLAQRLADARGDDGDDEQRTGDDDQDDLGDAAESHERMIPPWARAEQRGPPECNEQQLQPTINVSPENRQ